MAICCHVIGILRAWVRLLVMVAGGCVLSPLPSPDAAAQPSEDMGSPLFKRVPKRKRSAFVSTLISPSRSCGLDPGVDQHIHSWLDQAAAPADAATPLEAARGAGMQQPAGRQTNSHYSRECATDRMQPPMSQLGAASVDSHWEGQAAAAPAQQPAGLQHHAAPADDSPRLTQLPRQAQLHRHTPASVPAQEAQVQRAPAGSPNAPIAHPASFVLPPPDEDFLHLQSTLMPAHVADVASTPGMQMDQRLCTDAHAAETPGTPGIRMDQESCTDMDEEIDIMTVSPRAERPLSQHEPDQALQEAQPLQPCAPAVQSPLHHAGTGAQQEADQMPLQAEQRLAQQHDALSVHTRVPANPPAVQHAGAESQQEDQADQPLLQAQQRTAQQHDVLPKDTQAPPDQPAVQHASAEAQRGDRAERAAQPPAAATHDSPQGTRNHETLLQLPACMSQQPQVQELAQHCTQARPSSASLGDSLKCSYCRHHAHSSASSAHLAPCCHRTCKRRSWRDQASFKPLPGGALTSAYDQSDCVLHVCISIGGNAWYFWHVC